MSFQFSEKEIVHNHFSIGIARILQEQTQSAEIYLTGFNGENLFDVVQKARTCVLRIRATLRLAKSTISSEFSTENRRFREINSELSALREHHAVLQALEKLKYLSGNIDSLLKLEHLKEQIIEATDKNAEEQRRKRITIGQSLTRLRKAKQTFQSIQPVINNDNTLIEALDHAAQEVMRTYNNALQFGGDDDFYHWRKAVSALLYQSEALQNFAFTPAAQKRNFLERLLLQLEFYSDLTSLSYALDEWKEIYLDTNDYLELSSIAENQKRILTINLLRLGEKFFKMNFSPYKNACDEAFF